MVKTATQQQQQQQNEKTVPWQQWFRYAHASPTGTPLF